MSEPSSRHGYTRKAVDTSIAEAVRSGTVDPDRHAATITGARRVADAIDAQGASAPASLYGTFLAYCKALGITPDAGKPNRNDAGEGKLAEMSAKVQAKLKAV